MGMVLVSEGPVRITKTTVDSAWRRRAENTRLVLRDLETRGLALVVNPTGMIWRFDFKPRGTDPMTGKRFPSNSVTIGNPESHSPEEARREANRIKANLAAGGNPAGERKAKHRENAAKLAGTMDRLLDLYAEALPGRPKMRGRGVPSASYVADEIAHVRAAAAAMNAGSKAASDLSAADLRTLLRAEAKRPAVARHRFGAVSRFLDWCMDEGHVQANICYSIGKAVRPKPAAPRSRYLTPAQAAQLWKAAERMEAPVHRDFARFLLAVPCRRSEAARMEWQHLDLDAATWAQPDKLTKNGEPHRFHLPKLILDVLRARHAAAGEPQSGLVFPSPKSRKPLSTFSAINAELDGLAGMKDWAWHDLRRTFATALGEAGFPEAVADAVLNHRQAATRGGVLGVYQRAERWPERVAAMEAWAATLGAAIAGKAAEEKVADIAAARKRRATA